MKTYFISKCWWIRNWCLLFDIANELFYITNVKGNRAYHLFRVGWTEVNDDGNKAIAVLFTLLWVQFGFGWIIKGDRDEHEHEQQG